MALNWPLWRSALCAAPFMSDIREPRIFETDIRRHQREETGGGRRQGLTPSIGVSVCGHFASGSHPLAKARKRDLFD